MSLPFDDLGHTFLAMGATSGLDATIQALRSSGDHHGVFRTQLLKKRYELGLLLVNPGDLDKADPVKRKEYETFVETTCRAIGQRYLDDGNIPQAYRYFRTLGENEPVRVALEKLSAENFSDEVANIAVDQGVHPLRGFELTLKRHGLCRGITVFDTEFTTDLSIKKESASMLVQALYRDLVLTVGKRIVEKEGQLPADTDLVDLIRGRKWLFEEGRTHADPSHVGSVARIGMICEDEGDQIMALSIAEYGKLLGHEHSFPHRSPFEEGFPDYARYARALLGQNVNEACDYFREKLANYTTELGDVYAAEMVISLFWRVGKKIDALDLWQQHLHRQPAEVPGMNIDSYYELCIHAGEFDRLADCARAQNDSSAWAAARIMAADPHAPRG